LQLVDRVVAVTTKVVVGAQPAQRALDVGRRERVDGARCRRSAASAPVSSLPTIT
jgi:hypothetical protein